MRRHLIGLRNATALMAGGFAWIGLLDRAGVPVGAAEGALFLVVLAVTGTPLVRAVVAARRSQQQRIEVTPAGLVVTGGHARPRTLSWADVSAVRIRTTDQGPQLDDVFLEIRDGAGWVSIGSMHPAHSRVLAAVREHLADVDWAAGLPATRSMDDAVFPMWIRS